MNRSWSQFKKYFAQTLTFIGALVVVVTCTPLVKWCARVLPGPLHEPAAEVLIVLGASGDEEGIMGHASYIRSEYAIRAWRTGRFKRVVVSGGGKGVPPACDMRDFMVASGIPAEAIQVESVSLSTRENALFTQQLLDGKSGKIVLLSSDYHIYRATRVFRKVGLDAVPMPVPDVIRAASDWRGRWPAFVTLATEFTKMGYYSARGWM